MSLNNYIYTFCTLGFSRKDTSSRNQDAWRTKYLPAASPLNPLTLRIRTYSCTLEKKNQLFFYPIKLSFRVNLKIHAWISQILVLGNETAHGYYIIRYIRTKAVLSNIYLKLVTNVWSDFLWKYYLYPTYLYIYISRKL